MCCVSLGSMVCAVPSPFLSSLRIMPEHCTRLLSHPGFFSCRVTTAICHTKNTLKGTASKRHQYSVNATPPFLILIFHQPLPRLLCHGRILCITQFTPSNPTNQWAGNHCWSDSDWQTIEGWEGVEMRGRIKIHLIMGKRGHKIDEYHKDRKKSHWQMWGLELTWKGFALNRKMKEDMAELQMLQC